MDGYDFASLFTLSVDGAETKVTAAMLDGTVAAIAGEYTLTLTTDNKSVSVAVTVVEHEVVQAVVCYPQIRLSRRLLRTTAQGCLCCTWTSRLCP